MATEDYVINLLKDEFRVKFDCLPNSLSHMARILAEREQIKQGSRPPKAVLRTKGDVKIGSNWIVIREWEPFENEAYVDFPPSACHHQVYKISRSGGTRLDKLNFRKSFDYISEEYLGDEDGPSFFLFEPFLITFHRDDNYFEVFNLLEPHQSPRKIKREGRILGEMKTLLYEDDYGIPHCDESRYDGDLRVDGEIPESVLFPVLFKQDATSICVECTRISGSSMEVLFKETIYLPEEYYRRPRLLLLDRDNLVLQINLKVGGIMNDVTYGCVAFHICLSKRKVTRYSLPEISGYLHFGMVEECLGLAIDQDDCEVGYPDEDDENQEDDAEDNSDYLQIITFGVLSEQKGLEVLCFIKNSPTVGIVKQELAHFESYVDTSENTCTKFSLRSLLNHLHDMDQEKATFTREVMGATVTKPIIDLECFCLGETSEEKARKQFRIVDRSKIGCATRITKCGTSEDSEPGFMKEIEIFI
ncbi:Oidioi.mRNA.OKI2018_I69.XSR.g13899.t1.cds [Oikopleura dioica]|uniref:Oidioi.mRNA.OKI2018_I69.XSR.g13899.t1.cds n=1 Tax=Oikopleura dioica TaxID=34765 RepID=A0ABN7SC83_OIKDI|nr:Oidioi.mRNA.OKI2018_I69.XSR.g13899.t1.cds [Oikopleura dioica]